MTNTELLEKKILESGLKKKAIADKLNLSRFGLQKKIVGENEFKGSEIFLICNMLGIEATEMKRYFFCDDVECHSTNAESSLIKRKVHRTKD